ncbi:MAG: tetratricopeptide repeat protein [Rhodothermales bacterium]|nr:tetratricopeptide repeat protein [Rhodothermales bacterium]
MERMVGEQTIPFGSDLYRAGLRQFETNLGALLDAYRDSGVPVYIGTVASNEREQPPFIGAPSAPAASYTAAYTEAERLLAADRAADAVSAFTRVLEIDSTADAFYGRARSLGAEARHADAASDYTAAKDRDRLRFRAPEDINRIIRRAGEAPDVHLVETRRRLVTAARHGSIGHDLMLEHLHPNLDGYFLLSDAFYDALRETNFPERWARFIPAESARRELLLTDIDSLYGAYRVRQLTAAWPFAPPGSSDRSLDTLRGRTVPERLALDVLTSRKNWYAATDSLRAWHIGRGDLHEALKATLAIIQQYPFLSEPYARAGEILANQGRLPEARVYMLASLDRGESAAVLSVLGEINRILGRTNEAEANLRRALELRADDADTMFRLALLLASTNRSEEAAVLVDRILERSPEHPGATQLAVRLGLTAPR